MPSKIIKNVSPFEKFHSCKPDYSSLKVFGCLCYPLLRPYNKHKQNYRPVKATFLGYNSSHKRYKALLPDGREIVTRDIIFDELTFPYYSMSEKGIDGFSSISQSLVISSPSFLISSPPPPPSSPPSISPIPSISSSQSDPSSPSVYVPSSSLESDSPPTIPTDTQTSQPTHHITPRAKAGIYKPKVFSLVLSPNMLHRSALEDILIPI